MNAYGTTKRTLSDKLYDLLDDETCDMSEVCTKDELAAQFGKVLEDYTLVLKSGVIED